jgi:hypothetical protein
MHGKWKRILLLSVNALKMLNLKYMGKCVLTLKTAWEIF